MAPDIDTVLESLGASKFRSQFHLKEKDLRHIRDKGLGILRVHASGFIAERLVPAYPKNDGRQTPMKNHPVFIAQHATATCCRGCLEKWHHIPKGLILTSQQVDFIVDLIMAWIERDMQSGNSEGGT